MLYFLSRRLLNKQHSVSVAGALATVKIVNYKELRRSVCGYNVAVY